MDIAGFSAFFLLGALVIAISFTLDWLYAKVLPIRSLYYAIRLPGIVLHELSHVAGCLLAGARIQNVVLFSKEGGSVTYTEPRIPVLGTVIINTAPIILLPLVLLLLTWAFSSFLGCNLVITLPLTVDADLLQTLGTDISAIFVSNLIIRFNGWFLLYLYLCITVVLSLAPSVQDLRNAATGLVLVAVICLLIIYSAYGPAVNLLKQALDLLAYPFMLGLIFEAVACVVSLPLVVVFWIRNR